MGVGQPASSLFWASVSPSEGSCPAGGQMWSCSSCITTPALLLASDPCSQDTWPWGLSCSPARSSLFPPFFFFLSSSFAYCLLCLLLLLPLLSMSHFPLCTSPPLLPTCSRPAHAPGGSALAHLDFHQDGLLRELCGGHMVLEVFWARGVWGYSEEMKLGSASWGESKAGRNSFSLLSFKCLVGWACASCSNIY